MDRFEAMSMLISAVEQGSLSAASRELKVPLATLSRKISDLEALIGTRLLIRTTRKLSLTDAGQGFIEAARRILVDLNHAEREAAGEFNTPMGELVVTAPIMFGKLHVVPVVADFLEAFPQINVRLILSDRNVNLGEDPVDMAVRIGALPDSRMVATRVGEMRTVTCASPALLARYGTPATPTDLLKLPCITVDIATPAQHWRFQRPKSKAIIEIPVRPRLGVTTTEAAAEAALLGVGVTRLLHYQISEAVKRKKLVILLEAFERDPAPVHLVHASPGQMPLKMRRFLDFAKPRLAKSISAVSMSGRKRELERP